MTEHIRWPAVILPVVRSWWVIAAAALLAGGATAAYVLAQPRDYDASITLVSIGPSRQGPLPAGLASTLLGTQQAGVQATPAFVAKLVRLRSVLSAVADARVPAATSFPAGTVAERLLESSDGASKLPLDRQLRKVNEAIGTSVDRESGLITVQVVHHDTAMSRVLVRTAVEVLQEKFIAAAQGQAEQLRRAQDQRVDSAFRQVRAADLALSRFLTTNRVVAPYSLAAVEQRRLETSLQLAQQVYSQTMTEREAAIAKELESLPAVMVLDSLPDRLLPVSRRLTLKVVAAVAAAVALSVLLVVLRAAARNAYASAGPDGRALIASVLAVPLVGRLTKLYLRISPHSSGSTEAGLAPARSVVTERSA